jgi:hypothetical protein
VSPSLLAKFFPLVLNFKFLVNNFARACIPKRETGEFFSQKKSLSCVPVHCNPESKIKYCIASEKLRKRQN